MIDKRGSVPLLVCAVVPTILLTGIFAIDATRTWLARSRLQTALDAGALIAARDINSSNRDANVKALVAANYNANAPSGAAQISEANVTVTPVGTDKVMVGATADTVPLLSGLSIPGRTNSGWTTRQVARTATANRTATGIELALVMDTTLSMAFWDGTSTESNGSKPARIEYARRAARQLTSILYGSQTEYQPNLYISVVPFNVAINIGTGTTQQNWLTGTPPTYTTGHSWSGCVEARQNGYDRTEDAPSTTATKFTRYFWDSTYDGSLTSATGSCTPYQDYNTLSTSSGAFPCAGDNDWKASTNNSTNDQDNNPLLQAARTWAGGSVSGFPLGSGATTSTSFYFSPNFMCPTVSILPLTMDRATVERKIDELVGSTSTPYPFGFGTIVATGLQGAWFTLSPNFRGSQYWDDPNPVRANGTRLTPPSPLPLDYGTSKMNKVVVLLSDGDNNWYSARTVQGLDNASGTGSSNTLVRPESRSTTLFYSAYGRLSATSNRLGITFPTGDSANSTTLASNYSTVRTRADNALDTVMQTLCTNMKARGIIIYAIGVGIPSSDANARTQLSNCVTPKTNPSDPNERSKFINTTKASELTAAFTQVANELAELRLTQ